MNEPDRPLRRQYHQELDAIDQRVRQMFALVTERAGAATEAFLGDDHELADKVLRGEEDLDRLTEELEEAVERVLLLQSPMAGELRYVLNVLRIVPELERSGDLAAHVATRTGRGLAAQLTPEMRGIFEQMGTVAAELWRKVSEAFAARDPDAGRALDAADDELDALHKDLTERLLTADIDPGVAADASLMARFLERLGDHAAHIANRVSQLA